jgi:hypothetical protein
MYYKETDLLKLMCKENRIQRIVNYVKTLEKNHYINASDRETYLDQIEKRCQNISRELVKKRGERMEMEKKRKNEDNYNGWIKRIRQT